MIFDPVRRREVFHEFLLKFVCETLYERNSPLGNIAYHDVGTVISAWLVGLHEEIAPILPRLMKWLDHAIKEDEAIGVEAEHNFHRRKLSWAYALSVWMHGGVNVPQAWEAALYLCEAAARDDVYTKHQLKTERLDDYMAFCFQAQQYERGIAEFERYSGGKPLALNRTLAPRHIGYALCLHHAHGQFTPDELFQAGRRMLQAHLEEDWLGSGQAIEAATWLKIVYWHRDPTLTPLQTILKAYDDMPKVQRPEFV